MGLGQKTISDLVKKTQLECISAKELWKVGSWAYFMKEGHNKEIL